jgi:hypothetical protein
MYHHIHHIHSCIPHGKFLGREEDSLEVLIKASEFHLSAAECGLALIEKDVPLGISYINPPHKGQVHVIIINIVVILCV